MYKDKFVMAILYQEKALREISHKNFKQVVIPFNSEYKILLKNKHLTPCTARLFIDGTQVSMLGDFIIQPKSSIIVERFVTESLDKGKKFKFVPLSNPNVNDPFNQDNGLIEVEFRLANEYVPELQLKNIHQEFYDWQPYAPEGVIHGTSAGDYTYPNVTTNYINYNSNVSSGATVEGEDSRQRFTYSFLNVSDEVTRLKLKIKGVDKNTEVLNYKYCSKCGKKMEYSANYCVQCGTKF